MSYFLKKTTPTNKGLYLQIYESYYVPGKGKRNRSYKKLGYVSDFIKQGIVDPLSYFQNEVNQLNEERISRSTTQISNDSISKNLGYFLIKAMFDQLSMDKTLNIVSSNFKCHYSFSDMFRTLCYSQIISPGSKLKAFERVIPNIYNCQSYSYDQILDAINFIGADYHKYVEILNHHITSNWERNFNRVYFDCTNYYFEIDLEKDWLKKGPSKENQKCPLLGQALLLDADQIPLDTEFYPGNESEKPYLRKRIENMKTRNGVKGKVIQVADKGLNCARNIYSAVIEADDGYIFAKSTRGTSLSKKQKEWILERDEHLNKWTDVRNKEGALLYRYKTVKSYKDNGKIADYGIYTYVCKLSPDDEKDTSFTVKEKRIVTYNPSLAAKQRAEIMKEVDKVKKALSYKRAIKEDIGDSAKYLNIEAKDIEGKKVKIATSLNNEKINEDLAHAGFNLLVTSEIHEDPEKIYQVYHNLWRIEESFRLMKTYLEARPVYLSSKNSIYGHFLICYTSLTIIRLLELKTFEDKIPASKLIEFIRQYNITKNYDESYINCSTASETFQKIKEKLGLLKLGNVYLSKKDVNHILETELD